MIKTKLKLTAPRNNSASDAPSACLHHKQENSAGRSPNALRALRISGILGIAILILTTVLCAKMMSVSTSKANVRTGPGAGYDILWTVCKYTPFEIVDSKGKWKKVKDFSGETGWIHSSVLSNTPSVIVKTEKANLREDPGSNEILWVLQKTYPLKFIEKKENWYHVKDDEANGWLHKTTVWGFIEKEQIAAGNRQ